MTNAAFVFPGQGSQSVGMMTQWGEHQAVVDDLFEQASEVLGFNLKAVVSEGPAEQLNQTAVTQPAMLVSGFAAFRVWQSLDLVEPSVCAGHSLGEYTALVCAGSMQFADAVKLVAERGRLMQSAVAEDEGAMAAIIGLDDDAVVKACAAVEQGVVSAVNFNSPGQVVIGGNRASVEQAMDNARQLGAKRALPLPVSVPSHCALMEPAAERLAQVLESIDLGMPRVPVIHNQNADVADSVDQIRHQLRLQLFSPVLWVACVNKMQQMGVDTLIEMGPGKVLSGLARRIDRGLIAHAVFDADSLVKSKQTIGGS